MMADWIKAVTMPAKADSARREPVPELPDVLQTESGGYVVPEVPTIPVKVEGYVTTQELPAVRSTSRSISVTSTDTDAQELAGTDPRRKALTIWAETQGIYLCETRQGVTGTTPYGAHLPAGGSITINHQNPVWVRGDSASATLVSFLLEQRAD